MKDGNFRELNIGVALAIFKAVMTDMADDEVGIFEDSRDLEWDPSRCLEDATGLAGFSSARRAPRRNREPYQV